MTNPGSPFDLTGRLAVVTGCRRGIGFAMAQALASAGADIVGVSVNLEPDGSAIQRSVQELGRTFTPYRADLSDVAAVAALAQQLRHGDRPVDILVNNAGAIRRAPAVAHSDRDWDEILALDLSAPFRLAREIGKDMVASGSGTIILSRRC
jgi:2-deoxy-D-gluconate 3-dehydrogenase